MKRLFVLILITLPIIGFAQYFEAGPFIGASNYNGEFTEKFITFKETHVTYGGVVRLNFSQYFSLKANIYRGKVSGSDAYAEKYYHRRWTRNLHFQSTIVDFGIQPELNLKRFQVNSFSYRSAPYIFTGISVFKMNPQALYNNKWVNLQPLGTEGQNLPKYSDRKYKLVQIAIPIGLGWKYSIGNNISILVEASARKTFTDYIDDVSNTYVDPRELLYRGGQIAVNLMNRTGEVNDEPYEYTEEDFRGSPESKDWYYFLGFSVTYSFLPLGCMKY